MTANPFEGPSVAVRRALLSVSDKTGLLDLAKAISGPLTRKQETRAWK